MNQPNKVLQGGKPQTRQTFEEWIKERFGAPQDSGEWDMEREAWFAALDAVILPEGKRFEVGDKVSAVTRADGVFRLAVISAVDQESCQTRLPSNVRPLPQTRELTEQEKIDALMSCPNVTHVQLLIESFNGKTLDQLCEEYGVATTKEVE